MGIGEKSNVPDNRFDIPQEGGKHSTKKRKMEETSVPSAISGIGESGKSKKAKIEQKVSPNPTISFEVEIDGESVRVQKAREVGIILIELQNAVSGIKNAPLKTLLERLDSLSNQLQQDITCIDASLIESYIKLQREIGTLYNKCGKYENASTHFKDAL